MLNFLKLQFRMLIWVSEFQAIYDLLIASQIAMKPTAFPQNSGRAIRWDERREAKWEGRAGPRLPCEGDYAAGWIEQSQDVNILLLTYGRFQRCISVGFPTEGISAFHAVRTQHVPPRNPRTYRDCVPIYPLFIRNYLTGTTLWSVIQAKSQSYVFPRCKVF